MAKKYCKYTKDQLQEYCNDASYCVKCVDSTMHIGLPPWGLKKFDETVRSIVSAEKLNRFDSKLNGIVLDIRSIKVVGEQYAVRNDSSALHVSLNVKFYVFQPRIGAVLLGIVKHVAVHHISVTIHRFFNVMIPIDGKQSALKTNVSVMVKLTKFDLEDSIPYFEGKVEEILWPDEGKVEQKENSMDSGVSTTDETHTQVKREKVKNGRADSDDSNSDTSQPMTVKRETSHTNSHGGHKTTVRVTLQQSRAWNEIFNFFPNFFIFQTKVKQEPVSSCDTSSSDSEPSPATKQSTNKSKSTFTTTQLPIKLKNEKRSSSSSSSDDSSSNGNGKTKQTKRSTAGKATENGKRKRECGSSIIGRSLLKMKETRPDESESSSSSSSSDGGVGDRKKKMKNQSMLDTSFASPGLSSTRITTTKPTKRKAKSKDSGTNDFLKKMMSRFDE